MYSKILVPLDGSKLAETALPYARLLARRFEIAVELMTVIDTSLTDSHILGGKSRLLDSLVEQNVQSSQEYLSAIANSFSGAEIKCTVERGPTAEFIIHKGKVAAGTLIAMATHGRSGLNRWLLGSVAEKVLRGTANPLLLVRSADDGKTEGEATLQSIIVALDGSELSELALPPAFDLAQAMNVEVVLVRAFELPATAYYRADDSVGGKAFIPSYEELVAAMGLEAREYLDAKTKEARSQGLEKVRSQVLQGAAADEIINLARNTHGSLIAMCTHGRSGLKRWMIGSVTEKVVHHAETPILIIRAR